MKLFIVVALFAFLAVQLNQAAPLPDDDKKVEPVASNAPVVDSAVAAAPAVPIAKSSEAKPVESAVDSVAKAASAAAEAAKPAEEKKSS